MLEALLEAQGAVVTPEELLERAWDEKLDPLSNTVRMTVMTLRRKLGEPAADRDGPRERLPRVISNLRVRLTAIYGGIFVVFVALLLGVSYWLMGAPPATARCDAIEADAALGQLGTQYLLALAGATLVAAALGWALAGRELRVDADARSTPASASSPTPRTSCASPLTVIRTEADVTLVEPRRRRPRAARDGPTRCVDAVDEMDALLDGLMVLARSGHGCPTRESRRPRGRRRRRGPARARRRRARAARPRARGRARRAPPARAPRRRT